MNARPLRRCGAIGLAIFLVAGCAAPPADKTSGEDTGIRIESLRLTAADYMLDLRYRIVDPERATAFFSRKTEIYLVDPASGARLAVPNTPKLGKLRQVARKDMTGRSYFMLFANPGQFVRPGAKLTLVVGEIRVDNLRVEGTGGRHDANHKL